MILLKFEDKFTKILTYLLNFRKSDAIKQIFYFMNRLFCRCLNLSGLDKDNLIL